MREADEARAPLRDPAPTNAGDLTMAQWRVIQMLRAQGPARPGVIAETIGATVGIECAGDAQLRDVRTAYSYCSGNDPRVHFGLGKSTTVDSVRITWPDHTTSTFGSFETDRIIELRKP